jgi:hypothetical protein
MLKENKTLRGGTVDKLEIKVNNVDRDKSPSRDRARYAV